MHQKYNVCLLSALVGILLCDVYFEKSREETAFGDWFSSDTFQHSLLSAVIF